MPQAPFDDFNDNNGGLPPRRLRSVRSRQEDKRIILNDRGYTRKRRSEREV